MNLYRGKVTRVTNAGVFVEIKSTWPGVEWGPLKRVAYETTTRAAHSHTLGSAGDPAHTHSVTSLISTRTQRTSSHRARPSSWPKSSGTTSSSSAPSSKESPCA